jgi:hypothetical protein
MTWALAQLAVDSFLFLGLGALWFKLSQPAKDDPRLSRGLQLLQSKITVLEDLSDRTDTQVKQLSQLLDQKSRHIQDKIIQAEHQVLKVDQSMQKSLEVAEIFQDKIPHQEVLERKRTIEYVKAARMAYAKKSLEEIVSQVELPREQVELIIKFNREELMFDEEALPEWAKTAGLEPTKENYGSLTSMDFLGGLDTPKTDLTNLQSIGDNFKASVRAYETKREDSTLFKLQKEASPALNAISSATTSTFNTMSTEAQSAAKALYGAAQSISQSLTSTAAGFLSQEPTSNSTPTVRKVEFPRIDMPPK